MAGSWGWGLGPCLLPQATDACASCRRSVRSYTCVRVSGKPAAFRRTGPLTRNDAILLQGLLPADLERRAQDLREAQVAHSSWSVFVSPDELGRARGPVPRCGEAQGRCEVRGELPQVGYVPVMDSVEVWSNGDSSDRLGDVSGPRQELGGTV